MVIRTAFAIAFVGALLAVVNGAGGDALSGLLALVGLGGVWVLRHRLEQPRAHPSAPQDRV
jgi:hypothetical protein